MCLHWQPLKLWDEVQQIEGQVVRDGKSSRNFLWYIYTFEHLSMTVSCRSYPVGLMSAPWPALEERNPSTPVVLDNWEPNKQGWTFSAVCLALFFTTRQTSKCWSMSKERQRSWWRDWSTSLMMSCWGNWCCLDSWREGDSSSLQVTESRLQWGGCQSLLPSNKRSDKKKWPQVMRGEV